jgi:hypothetical protein
LNTQQAGDILPVGWATKLINFVYDDVGRLASRNGSTQQNAAAIAGSPTVRTIHEYIDDSGSTLTLFAAGNAIYSNVSGTITDISGTITAPTADDWQFANFNGTCVGFQSGHAPIVLSSVAGTFADATGTQFNGSMVLSAYGRIWTVFDNELKYSDLLINNFSGGSSGAFDLSEFWPNGMDEAVALADFNGWLIVFGKDSIIVYESPDDVAVMGIVEGIDGIGCIARDSIQIVGTEIVFLSNTGLRSLGRTIQEKATPIGDLSRHVRDSLLNKLTAETNKTQIKSVYNRNDGFYLLSLPQTGESFYFDLKFPQQDGSWKVTTWDLAPTGLMYSADLTMFMAVDDGFISTYVGFRDGVDSGGSGGSSFSIDYEGVWNDFERGGVEGVSNLLKIPKQVSLLGSGNPSTAVTFKFAYDYSDTFFNIPLNFSTATPAQYGIGQYGLATYATAGSFERVKGQLKATGQVIKTGVTTTIDGQPFAMQRLDLLAKIGRLAL